MPLMINKLIGTKPITLEYNPTLESVLMVEKLIEKTSGEFSVYHLWQKLPRKMSYQSFKIIISYLLFSNKITISRNLKVVWIWNPQMIDTLEKNGLVKYV